MLIGIWRVKTVLMSFQVGMGTLLGSGLEATGVLF
jgi:hypothetical protein